MSVFDSHKSHAIVNERLYIYIVAPKYVDTWLFLTESNLVGKLQIERSSDDVSSSVLKRDMSRSHRVRLCDSYEIVKR